MINITLPDSSQRQFEAPVSIYDIAMAIGPGLAKAALAGKINDKLVDTSTLVEQDANIAIITAKNEEGLEIIRHSTAHLLAHAVKQLFPAAQVTIGPVIENGFYYDFAFERTFTPDDLVAIETRMAELAQQDIIIKRSTMSRDEAVSYFRDLGEEYKAEIIEAIPADQELSLYNQNDFTDLCRGPHVPSTGKLQAFKLMKLAGAYWRGDSNNEMLQRIYGTAWTDKKALKEYLHLLEESEKRDHRKVAKKMDLFHMQDEAPGLVFWHPNGWTIYNTIKDYLRQKLRKYGYQEVNTPQIVDRSLWERSGHTEKFDDDMFVTESENRTYLLKPMNCPCHVQIFNQGLKSYRDLPLRLAEFGCCHRNEPSGALHGIMRVRGFTQDDAHIFCTPEQIGSESLAFVKLLYEVYADFGFTDINVKLSTRPAKRVGSDEVWDQAEADLEKVLNDSGVSWAFNPGEGAFYGPKIEFSLRDCIGRVWQLGTLQLDFNLPVRLDAQYVTESGERKPPVMLHRAIFGSMERFIGILLEHYAEGLPAWLAPIQVAIMNITDNQASYCHKIEEILQNHAIRSKLDLRNEKIGYKIRERTIERIPYLLVIGDREVEQQEVSVRTQAGEDLGSMSIEALVAKIKTNCLGELSN